MTPTHKTVELSTSNDSFVRIEVSVAVQSYSSARLNDKKSCKPFDRDFSFSSAFCLKTDAEDLFGGSLY